MPEFTYNWSINILHGLYKPVIRSKFHDFCNCLPNKYHQFPQTWLSWACSTINKPDERRKMQPLLGSSSSDRVMTEGALNNYFLLMTSKIISLWLVTFSWNWAVTIVKDTRIKQRVDWLRLDQSQSQTNQHCPLCARLSTVIDGSDRAASDHVMSSSVRPV